MECSEFFCWAFFNTVKPPFHCSLVSSCVTNSELDKELQVLSGNGQVFRFKFDVGYIE